MSINVNIPTKAEIEEMIKKSQNMLRHEFAKELNKIKQQNIDINAIVSDIAGRKTNE